MNQVAFAGRDIGFALLETTWAVVSAAWLVRHKAGNSSS